MSTLASTLSSRRFRRTLPWVSALVLVAGIVAFSIAYLADTGKKFQLEATGPVVKTAKPQPTVRVDPKARRVAGEFIVTAVTRKDVAKAYTLAHPEFRSSVTRKEWLAGTLPGVTYFPPEKLLGATFKVDESHPREVFLSVLMIAKPNSGVKSQDFAIGLKAVGTGDKKRWLVNYFAPLSGGGMVPNVG
ncbi:MAG: hypothetical protein M3540_06025 [Actinomycetota bacterium]|nr:hypothetical protein [Actinomycetota bacterium]